LHVAFTLPVAVGATIAALFSLLLFIAALARCCSRMSPRVTSRPGVRLQAVIAMLNRLTREPCRRTPAPVGPGPHAAPGSAVRR